MPRPKLHGLHTDQLETLQFPHHNDAAKHLYG